MRWSLAIFFAIAGTNSPLFGGFEIWSYARESAYLTTVTDKLLNAAPVWKKEADNPPLSARNAIKLAGKKKETLVKDSETFRWVLKEATLAEDTGRWYWRVTYTGYSPGVAIGGRPPFLNLIVLMDGTVVEPVKKR